MKSFKNLLALSLVGLTLLTACSKTPAGSVETTVTTTAKTEEIPVPTDETVANINSFLTELSMCRLGDFQGEKDYNRALTFAFTYALEKDMLQTVGDYFELKYEDANNITEKYFGITLPEESIADYRCRDGAFYIEAGAGEAVGGVSIAKECVQKSGGVFEVTAYVFTYAEPHPSLDEYESALAGIYTNTVEDMKNSNVWEYAYTANAQIRQNDNGTFTLLKYEVQYERN